jgi:arginyl-tRNA synthetase
MELGILVPFDPIQNSSQNEFYKQQMDYTQYQTEDEINLIKLIYKYPEIIKETVTDLKPHILARYLLTLSQEFNQFYHSCQILKEQKNLRHMRLFLSEIVRKILKNGLKLLTIDVLNEM